MGFNSVYQTLRELFTQVDARILKAVAIEYSKDPDGAVESILTKVLPFIGDQSNITSSGDKSLNCLPPSVEGNGKTTVATFPCSSMPVSVEGEDVNPSGVLKYGLLNDSVCLSEAHDDSLASSFYDAKDTDDQLCGNSKNDGLIPITQFPETGCGVNKGSKFVAPSARLASGCSEENNDELSKNLMDEAVVPSHEFEASQVDKIGNSSSFSNRLDDGEADASSSNGDNGHLDRCIDYPSLDLVATVNVDSHEKKAFLNCNSVESRISTEHAAVIVNEHSLDALSNDVPLSNVNNQELNSYEGADFVEESPVVDATSAKDDTMLGTIITSSGQICKIDLLKDIVEDANNYKDMLFSAKESVISFIQEVELREKEAKDAKDAAAKGGTEIYERVEELKRMLKHAKELNDMHAGEVYGEKSILATEVRELQTRLLGLADEKDKSLSILDEMRETLESRLLVAEEEIRAAEQERLDKVDIARGALAEQELIMEKVVQESKLLQQEAEENAKLRDFLMDKGRLVDTLQGEISVICQDVKSLRENFDNRVSLSKSLSFRQTSCRLASSNSSIKSMASDLVPGPSDLSESPSRISRATSVECQTPRSSTNECVKAAAATARKELLDEDWELFDF